MSFHVPGLYRIRKGRMSSDHTYGNNGAFRLDMGELAIASDGLGWEHVSVSLPTRVPTWQEMCRIKRLFWDDDDVVVQYHPREKDYVNCHHFCLHLWRPTDKELPAPPSGLV